MLDDNTKEFAILFGEAILLASMQFSIGSVEMSSKFSVKNFSKDQETLQNAADALSDYLKVALFWTLGLGILFYAKYNLQGFMMILLTNILIISWIYYSYISCFEIAANTYNLKKPIISLI